VLTEQAREPTTEVIQMVDVKMLKPLEFEGRYLWHPQPADAEQQLDYLPREIFDRLTGMIPRDNPRVHTMVKAYTSESAAWRALANAIDTLHGEQPREGGSDG
jgi:hypothetical protein